MPTDSNLMSMLRAAATPDAPVPTVDGERLREYRGSIKGVPVDTLDKRPGRPGYQEIFQGSMAPEVGQVAPSTNVPSTKASNSSTNIRVAIYLGRGDSFVVNVEEAPEWDTVDGGAFKMDPQTVLSLCAVLRVVGIKIKDCTGGELTVVRSAHEQPPLPHRFSPPPIIEEGERSSGLESSLWLPNGADE